MRWILAAVLCFPALAAESAPRNRLVGQYCLGCHAKGSKTGLALEGVDAGDAAARPDIWEKVARKLEAGEMPPVGVPRPGGAVLRGFADGLVRDLDDAARRAPFAGRTVIRRLNRTEYANAIRDLLAVELPLAAELPEDGIAAGFDNIADALSMSPLLLERYLKVARRVSELATGTAEASTVTEIYPATETQAVWQNGMPFGTRGGIRVRHYFPVDGEYDLRAFLDKESLTPTEGVRFFRTRVRVEAGAHTVIVTFPDEFAAREGPVSDVSGPGGKALGGVLDLLGTAVRPTIDFRMDGRRVKLFEIAGMTAGEAAFDGQPGPPTLARIEITGPVAAAGVSETESQRRIFVCRERSTACASRILTGIARRAFRRDVTSTDVRPYVATYESAAAKAGFEQAIAVAVRDILLAPDFLFRLEFDGPGGGAAHSVSAFELASRLSFFLWSTIPDDGLLDRAAKDDLLKPGALAAEVRRMLADPRSEALADNFAAQWLGLRTLEEAKPDRASFPEFDSALEAAFRRETELFIRSVMRENRPAADLLGANYTYLNDRLARHYGVPGVVGAGFRRVTLPAESHRGGLLAQGSVLMLTSHSTRTSPVLRGKWLLDNLLNSPPPPPPANVPALDESPSDGRKLTTREQMERHRKNPVCAGCHLRIDALGFALENYDVIGRWRTDEGGSAIDTTGQLPGGRVLRGPDGLRELMLEDGRFTRGMVERLMTYALGRQMDARDQPAVREVLRTTKPGGYRFQDVVAAVASSVPFRMKQAGP
ncbi:MAG: DUF1592 domain-containing protein [Bryobacteraceae bacterium]